MSPLTRSLTVIVLLAMTAPGLEAAPAPFFQGFEIDNSGWNVFTGQYDATRVASGTHGVPSRSGSFHAEAGQFSFDTGGGSAATDWGGATGDFPAGGYVTRVAVYLDVAGDYANDTRFDWDSAISNAQGGFARDFAFNCGFYDDSDATGSAPRFVCSASNNVGRQGSFPRNPQRNPLAMTSTGWYVLQHRFYDAGAGVLACDLSLIDGSGKVLRTWTLSDPSDIIGASIGGHQFGWFAGQELPFLAFDDSERTGVATVGGAGPARIWIGLANSDDVGIRFDVEVTMLAGVDTVATGRVDGVAGGSSGFNNARLVTVPLTLAPEAGEAEGKVSLVVRIRNACAGSGKNSGKARVWFNGQAVDTGAARDAGSRVSIVTGDQTRTLYLRSPASLLEAAGTSRKSVDVSAGGRCSAFKTAGTFVEP